MAIAAKRIDVAFNSGDIRVMSWYSRSGVHISDERLESLEFIPGWVIINTIKNQEDRKSIAYAAHTIESIAIYGKVEL